MVLVPVACEIGEWQHRNRVLFLLSLQRRSRLLGNVEPVAQPPHGREPVRLVAKRLAQGGDVDLDRILLDDHARPHGFEDLVLGDDLALGLSQH